MRTHCGIGTHLMLYGDLTGKELERDLEKAAEPDIKLPKSVG